MVFAMTFFMTGCQKQAAEENTKQEAAPEITSEATTEAAGK